jgi:hypothetical protein
MRRLPLARVAIVVSLLMPPVAFAQDVTEPALKAAFIYNFIRFTEWPEPFPASDPFVICVAGDSAVSQALERVVKGREFSGRRLVVSSVAISEAKEPCRVLYVSGVTASQGVQLLARLERSPVLTISDLGGFTEAGGMAEFFFERGRLRFNINLEAAKRSGLQMSSRLLALANRI